MSALASSKALDYPPSVEELRAELRRSWTSLKDGMPERIIVIGAADEGERLVRLCRTAGIAVAAVADDAPARQGKNIAGTGPVVPVEALNDRDRAIPVIIASHRVLDASKRLKRMGFQTVAPFALLQCLAPGTFPPHMFYADWLEDLSAHWDRYHALAGLLADDLSRRVLDACIAYRRTCDPHSLESVVDRDLYNTAGIFAFAGNEVYVDGGAFDGDSVALFIARAGGKFDRIIAFEPDPETFRRLRERFAHDPRIEAVNKGLYSHATSLRFANAGTRASSLTDGGGGIAVPVAALDEVLDGSRVTFVKMNIEGAELAALDGAAGAIRSFAPRLAISAYHRASDLWQIPLKVRALRPDYRLYLRQHDGGVIETVLYAVAESGEAR